MIKSFVITEKSSNLQQNNCYTILVEDNANKIEIKKFLESKYNVNVLKVNVLKKLGKKVRRGRIEGKTKSYKKAYVFTDSEIKFIEED